MLATFVLLNDKQQTAHMSECLPVTQKLSLNYFLPAKHVARAWNTFTNPFIGFC